MKSTCINHPIKEPINIYRKWQLVACGGNIPAAIMLNFFEYWHNVKLEILERQQEMSASFGDLDETLLSLIQWHTNDQIEERTGLKRHAIAKSIKQLEELGFIKTMRNPNPRYSFDATRHFLFYPDVVNRWIDEYIHPSAENCNGATEKCSRPNEFCKYPKTSTKDVFKDHHDQADADFSEKPILAVRTEEPTANKPNDADDPFFSGQARMLAREVVKVTREIQAPKNFITDAPWGKLAEELGQDALKVWKEFEQYMIAVHADKKDPQAYVGKIATNLYQNPGSELANKNWTLFADHFKTHLSAPPPPKTKAPKAVVIDEIPDREESAKAARAARESFYKAIGRNP
jgi:transcription initiation factor IIE alpha subunit